MRVHVRVLVLALLACVLTAAFASAAQAVEAPREKARFIATNCEFGFEACGSESIEPVPDGLKYIIPKEKITDEEAETEGFTQAGGRVPFGVTDFKIKTIGEYPNAAPTEIVKHVRVDVSSGLATSPAAVPMCSAEEFGNKEVAPESGLFLAPTCKGETEIGTEQVTLYLGENALGAGISDLPISGTVYNLVQPEGLASYYGAALPLPKAITEAKGLGATQFYVHSFVEGNVEWGEEAEGTGAGDYHDYFKVNVSTAIPLISSRQVLYGTRGNGAFITNATACPGDHTTYLSLENTASETTRESFTTPIALKGCESLAFEPKLAFSGGSTISDEPDQLTTEVSEENNPEENSPSQVKTASITLPEGMTLNPSAANELEACTPSQARIHSDVFGVEC
ncbi:MAG TPA: hypothetical protein VK745_23155, partial [Polyangiaceae bacterium]|nr:hypothetical protein [Polyangiaceae bacterium]